MSKTYNIKFFQSDGTLLNTLQGGNVRKSQITFSQKINGNCDELELDLNVDYTTSPTWTDPERYVRVYEINDSNPQGYLIYTGFISQRLPYFSKSIYGIKLKCLGVGYLLSRLYYTKLGAYIVSESNVDPATIAKNIIDYAISVYGSNWLKYNLSDIVSVGTLVTANFTQRKCSNALNDCLGLAGGSYFWSIDGQGYFRFKPKDTTVTHVFTAGKDLDSAQIPLSAEEMINTCIVQWNNGGVFTEEKATDAGSIATYGIREAYFVQHDILNLTSATQFVNQKLNDYKNTKRQATITVNNLYDLSSIKAGQTCNIRNIKTGQNIFSDNMQITSVNFNETTASLNLESLYNDYAKTISNSLNDSSRGGLVS